MLYSCVSDFVLLRKIISYLGEEAAMLLLLIRFLFFNMADCVLTIPLL